jgi:hypothetical protein
MAQSTYTGRPDQISDLKENANEQLGRAAERAESVANRVAGQGREACARSGREFQDCSRQVGPGSAYGHTSNCSNGGLRARRSLEILSQAKGAHGVCRPD